MTPYGDLPYFIAIILATLPAIALGWIGRSRRGWLLFITALMGVVHFAKPTSHKYGITFVEVAIVAGFGLAQFALARGFLRYRSLATARRWIVWPVIGAAIGPLALAKMAAAGLVPSTIGFMGLSYLTFRAVDVLLGVHDKLVTRIEIREYLSYVFFFPAVSAGPIDRFRRFAKDYQAAPTRQEVVAGVDRGVDRIFTGLLYKFVIAVLINHYWVARVPTGVAPAALASYAYGYSAYLFFDFAGYSALAVGFSELVGIHTPENFNRPFLARNIADFWSRWHISLSSWFRDNIFTRFTLAATKRRWFSNRYITSYLGLAITFTVMGAWHGLEARYLAYGLYHALLSIVHNLIVRGTKRWPSLPESKWWQAVSIVATFNAVCFGFLIFSGRLG